MKYLIKTYVVIQNIIYFFIKLFKTDENKIFFLSRQANTPTLDYRMLISEIKKQNDKKKIVVYTKRIEKSISSFLIKSFFSNLKVMYHLATSKVVVIDGYNMPVSILHHKDNLIVIQIWHSLAAIKKFGLASLNTEREKMIAKELKMHKNYDYIITGSKKMIPYFEESFGYDKSNFIPLGLPRIDYILKSDKTTEIYKKYPQLKNKKVILYAPTFRNIDNYKIEELIENIDTKKYNLIFKAHEKMRCIINDKNIYTCDEFSSIDLLSITDYLITDYSAISVEASILDIPIYLYAYDLDEYNTNPGLNIDLKKELPTFEDAKELYNYLDHEKYNYELLKTFKDNYLVNLDGSATKKIANFIIERSDEND